MSVLDTLKSKNTKATVAAIKKTAAEGLSAGIKKFEQEMDHGFVTEDIGGGLRRWSGMVDAAMAAKVLDFNNDNRPLRQFHIRRLANQIALGKWKINGDTVAIATNGDVLNGQHRLWAVLESSVPVFMVFIFGISRDAFSTMDTIRMSRSASDTLALCKLGHHRTQTAGALLWLIRYQRGYLPDVRNPAHRVENSDIEEAYRAHPHMARATEAVLSLRRIMNLSIAAFVYYVLVSHDEPLAARLLKTLEDPAGVALSDPLYKLRSFLINNTGDRRRDPLSTIAIIIKAINAAHAGEKPNTLSWRCQGKNPEEFPQFWFRK